MQLELNQLYIFESNLFDKVGLNLFKPYSIKPNEIGADWFCADPNAYRYLFLKNIDYNFIDKKEIHISKKFNLLNEDEWNQIKKYFVYRNKIYISNMGLYL